MSDIGWREGDVPVSSRFDDPYFSLENGLDEARYVFLRGNDLPERFTVGFQVAELGFGTGLNLLATWQAWEDCGAPGVLRFTSFEAFPMPPEDMARALAAFPEVAEKAGHLVQAMRQGTRFRLGSIEAEVIPGDARETLPRWQGKADAWFLDGFAPARNPELWEPDLLLAVAKHSAPGGTLATYTAAGDVRRALEAAGFEIERVPGFGRKRHMTRGRLR